MSTTEAVRVSINIMNHAGGQLHYVGLRRRNAALFCDIVKRNCIDYCRQSLHILRPSLISQCNARERPTPSLLPWRSCSYCNLNSTRFSSKENGDDELQEGSTTSLSDLSVMIKESYATGETDGVQSAMKSNRILAKLSDNLDAEDVANVLIDAAIEAAEKDRGALATMLNSILATCCGTERDNSSPLISLAILKCMDEMHSLDETSMVAPDIVSLSLVYYALNQASIHNGVENASQAILERAQKLAKKAAGSQRRKELNMERRRGTKTNDIDSKQTESNLQSLYGPDIRILHETSDVIVIAKPAGMVCYHTKRTGAGKITSSRKKNTRAANENNDDDKGAKWMDISVADALIDSSVSLSTLNPSARGVVHRLDRGTSGSLVLAKSDEMHLILTALFFLRKVEKTYLALVPGCSTNHSGIGMEDEDMKQIVDKLSLGSTGVIDVHVDGRPARSTYRVVKQYGKSTSPTALLLEVATLTGRKHQVRVHCASLGHPIFFDPLYSSSSNIDRKSKTSEKKQKKQHSSPFTIIKESEKALLPKAVTDLLFINSQQQQQERFFLHAATLTIEELGISVDAPLPQWWVELIEQLENAVLSE
jgi:23S rRNA-/tRNA-specific pseudouridylate synthase